MLGVLCAPAFASAADSLLIVAPAAYRETLRSFVDHKRQDMPTSLVSLETALQEDGVDDAERLKRFLFHTWKTDHVTHVLLVGDADVMPVRYMVLDRNTGPAFDYAFYPSDLYYADLTKPDGSFESWNAHHDGFHAGYFGEVRGEHNKSDAINYDAIDYKPEIALGRWPVNSVEEVRRIAEKTIQFEKAPALDDVPEQIGLLAVGGWIDNRGMMEAIAKKLTIGNFNLNRLYYADKNESPATPPPNAAQTIGLINRGCLMLLHSGHGSDDFWADCIGVANIKQMTNASRPAIFMSAGCSTARFATLPPYEPYMDAGGKEHAGTDHGEVFTAPPPPPACYQKGKYNPTGLGEQLLRSTNAGAVVYIGCNTGSQPCGMTLMDGLADSLSKEPSARFGDHWKNAVAYYYDREHLATIKPTPDWYPASIFFQGMKFMYFGDPSLRMEHLWAKRHKE